MRKQSSERGEKKLPQSLKKIKKRLQTPLNEASSLNMVKVIGNRTKI